MKIFIASLAIGLILTLNPAEARAQESASCEGPKYVRSLCTENIFPSGDLLPESLRASNGQFNQAKVEYDAVIGKSGSMNQEGGYLGEKGAAAAQMQMISAARCERAKSYCEQSCVGDTGSISECFKEADRFISMQLRAATESTIASNQAREVQRATAAETKGVSEETARRLQESADKVEKALERLGSI